MACKDCIHYVTCVFVEGKDTDYLTENGCDNFLSKNECAKTNELKKLEIEVDRREKLLDEWLNRSIAKEKAAAITEFAHKIKSKARIYYIDFDDIKRYRQVISCEDIDEIMNQMINAQEQNND